MCYKKLGNYEEGVKDYTNAIRLEGNNGNFYYNRAIAYMSLTPPDHEKALEDYELAVQLSQSKYGRSTIAATACAKWAAWPRAWRT